MGANIEQKDDSKAHDKVVDPQAVCSATLYHGPGHQSRAKCHLKGRHKIHFTVYGNHRQEARWKGKDVCTGFFDEPPAE